MWSAEPGIDLFGQIGVVIRAFIEGLEVARAADDSSLSYPGFARATASAEDFRLEKWDSPSKWQFIGTKLFHILRTTATGNRVEVFICDNDYLLGYPEREKVDPYWTGGLPEKFEMEYTRTDADKGLANLPPPQPKQEGPRVFPGGDVFGDWRITKIIRYRLAFSDQAEWESLSQACKHAASLSDDTPGPSWISRNDPRFVPKPPSPGWPEPGRA